VENYAGDSGKGLARVRGGMGKKIPPRLKKTKPWGKPEKNKGGNITNSWGRFEIKRKKGRPGRPIRRVNYREVKSSQLDEVVGGGQDAGFCRELFENEHGEKKW